MTLNAVVFPAPFGPISPVTEPSCTSSDTSSSATMPPKRREACSRERRPMRRRKPTESPETTLCRGSLVPGGDVLVPELLHRRRARCADVRRVVRRVVHRPHDPAAVGAHIEDVDASGRLLEAAEEGAVAGERVAEDGA